MNINTTAKSICAALIGAAAVAGAASCAGIHLRGPDRGGGSSGSGLLRR